MENQWVQNSREKVIVPWHSQPREESRCLRGKLHVCWAKKEKPQDAFECLKKEADLVCGVREGLWGNDISPETERSAEIVRKVYRAPEIAEAKALWWERETSTIITNSKLLRYDNLLYNNYFHGNKIPYDSFNAYLLQYVLVTTWQSFLFTPYLNQFFTKFYFCDATFFNVEFYILHSLLLSYNFCLAKLNIYWETREYLEMWKIIAAKILQYFNSSYARFY